MKTKVLFMCMAICAMMMGLVSCDPINSPDSPLIGEWAVDGDTSRSVEFDSDNVTIIRYDPSGEVFSKISFPYNAKGKRIAFGLYTADFQIVSHECTFRFEGDSKLIINDFVGVLYYGASEEPPFKFGEDIILSKKGEVIFL